MWYLIFIILIDNEQHKYKLEAYVTQEECKAEQARIFEAMTIAYPGDHTFSLDCKYKVVGKPL